FAVSAITLLAVSPVTAARRAATVVIWVGSAQQASIQKSATAWGKSPVTISVHDFASIRTDLQNVTPANAPDVIVGQNDWLGELVPSGSLLPLYPTTAA